MKSLGRWVLGLFLMFTGTMHFVLTDSFVAQVPLFLPWPTAIIYLSGVVEIALGCALILVSRNRAMLGLLVAGFFVAIFPGNISQYLTHTPAFGLDSDLARGLRLLFQPVLIVWTLWCTEVRTSDWLPRR